MPFQIWSYTVNLDIITIYGTMTNDRQTEINLYVDSNMRGSLRLTPNIIMIGILLFTF